MKRMINASVIMVVFLVFGVGVLAGSFAAEIEVLSQKGDNPWRIVRRENPRASEQEIAAEVINFLERNNISDPTKLPVGEIVLVNRLDNAAETAEQGLESFRNDRNKIWNTVIFGLGVVVMFVFGAAVVIYLKKGLKALDTWETKSIQRQNVNTKLGQELVEALNNSERGSLVLGQAVLGLGRNVVIAAECFKSNQEQFIATAVQEIRFMENTMQIHAGHLQNLDARVSAELERIREAEAGNGKNGPGSLSWQLADGISKISQSLDVIYRSSIRDTSERLTKVEKISAEIMDFLNRARNDSEYAIEGKHPLDKFASRKQVQDMSELVQDIAWELDTQKKRLKKLELLKANFETLQETGRKLYNIEYDSHRAIEGRMDRLEESFKQLSAKKEDKK